MPCVPKPQLNMPLHKPDSQRQGSIYCGNKAWYETRRLLGRSLAITSGLGATGAGSTSAYLTAMLSRKPFKAERSPRMPHCWKTWHQRLLRKKCVAAFLMANAQSSLEQKLFSDNKPRASRRRKALRGPKQATSRGWT